MDVSYTKDLLIKAGISDIREHGIRGISMRRISSACNVSCAAPYRHFKNKEEFIAAIFGYIKEKWCETLERMSGQKDDVKTRIVDACMLYLRFLLDNPDYRSILLIHDDSLSAEQRLAKTQISDSTMTLIDEYCRREKITDSRVRQRKTYVVKSLIYGAAIMIESGELSDSDDTCMLVRQMIEREFDIV